MIYQSRNLKTDIVLYDNLKNNSLINLLKKIKDNGFEVISRNYTTDLNIPVIKTWIFNKHNYNQFAYSGYGSSLYPEIALELSITEVIQAYPHYDKIRLNKFIRQTHPDLTIDNISLYSLSYFYNKEMKFNEKQIDINNLEFNKPPKSIEESIKIIAN